MIDASQITDWIPARVSWQGGKPLVDWCFVEDGGLSEPDFEQTLNRCIQLPFNLLFRQQTPIDFLSELRKTRPGLKPTGFIFHLTRSGSALISRMLSALPTNMVLSEVRPIDSLIRSTRSEPSISNSQQIEWLQAMVGSLAQQRRGDERNLFIKFHSWNIIDLPIIKSAFPGVPWVFIYRDPIEVLVSQLHQRGAHMVPGLIDPQMFEMDLAAISNMEPEMYCARVLKVLCEAALRHRSDGGLLINYSQLPAEFSMISRFFRLSWTDVEMEAMISSAANHSKNLSTPFNNDAAAKASHASARLRESAQTWVYPAYNALEQARMAQSQPPLDACDPSPAVRS